MPEPHLSLTSPSSFSEPPPGFWPQPVDPGSKRMRWGCGDIGFGLLLMVVATLAISIPAVLVEISRSGGSVLDAGGIDTNAPLIVGSGLLATWLGLGGWSFVASRWRGLGTLRDDFQFWFRLPADVWWGVAGGAVALLAGAGVALVESMLGIEAVSNGEFLPQAREQNLVAFVLLGLAAAVGAPLVEELFFRGLAFTAVQRRLGGIWAVVISTVVFGLLHAQPAPTVAAGLFLVVHITVFGGVLGALRLRTGRCGASVIAHMTINGFGVALVALGLG